jgi:hypothetical protein
LGKEPAVVLYRKILAVALLVGLVAFGVGCTDGDEPKAAPKVVRVVLKQAGPADLISPAAGIRKLDDAVVDQVGPLTQRYFDATVQEPLLTGKRGDISKFFTATAAKDATGPDRGAVFDVGLPRVRILKAEGRSVQFTGYADNADRLALVVAKFVFDVSGDGTRVHVVHRGELMVEPLFGSWYVTGYNVITSRTTGGVTTTTKATS